MSGDEARRGKREKVECSKAHLQHPNFLQIPLPAVSKRTDFGRVGSRKYAEGQVHARASRRWGQGHRQWTRARRWTRGSTSCEDTPSAQNYGASLAPRTRGAIASFRTLASWFCCSGTSQFQFSSSTRPRKFATSRIQRAASQAVPSPITTHRCRTGSNS